MNADNSFERILIVGVGLIGGSLGLALKRKGFAGEIIGVDEQTALDIALQRKVIDRGFRREELHQATRQADLIFLCTPIAETLRLLATIGKDLQPGTLITDVGSTKRQIVEAAKIHLPADVDFIGGHPMAGSEFRGVEAADPFLFENTTYVLTPSRPTHFRMQRAFGELLERIGAKVLLLLPELHDEIAAAVSHLPQMLAVSLMHLVASRQDESPYFLKMAAGGFRDMTRIASSPYGIWEDIIRTNSDMIVRYIDDYIEELHKLKLCLHEQCLAEYFDKAAKNRLSIPKDTKGFLQPHYDLLIGVEDKPGVIAGISNALSERQINIKDIEVLKIRENEGGTMRLAFSSREDRDQAATILRQVGFDVRTRE
ncbi:MAG TPA: prephenate dehydrogenase [bacterium]|nr:prephenate dehydrogenase [bacterium]HNT65197.1 prephenate dehydrogenase [bacterium]HOX87000.1 prephenate dehydrogenase [bacterium]HPG46331.1 prephenate dehydrogenase [bacterium]HPM98475.1 prephenate dehydrogenase [bacterium]